MSSVFYSLISLTFPFFRNVHYVQHFLMSSKNLFFWILFSIIVYISLMIVQFWKWINFGKVALKNMQEYCLASVKCFLFPTCTAEKIFFSKNLLSAFILTISNWNVSRILLPAKVFLKWLLHSFVVCNDPNFSLAIMCIQCRSTLITKN